MGRYRRLPEINSRERGLKNHSERAAINTPIQGGAADIAMAAMIKLVRNEKLKSMGWKLLLQVMLLFNSLNFVRASDCSFSNSSTTQCSI
jgi:DNA polymerase I-like protein with 3'-5' exonuclease and polymerase domains